jgi:hypothetical protein
MIPLVRTGRVELPCPCGRWNLKAIRDAICNILRRSVRRNIGENHAAAGPFGSSFGSNDAAPSFRLTFILILAALFAAEAALRIGGGR